MTTSQKFATALLVSTTLATSASAFGFFGSSNAHTSSTSLIGSGSEEMDMGIGSQSGDGHFKIEPGQVTYCFNFEVNFMGQSMHMGWSGTAGMNGFGQHGYGDNGSGEGTIDIGEEISCDYDGSI